MVEELVAKNALLWNVLLGCKPSKAGSLDEEEDEEGDGEDLGVQVFTASLGRMGWEVERLTGASDDATFFRMTRPRSTEAIRDSEVL